MSNGYTTEHRARELREQLDKVRQRVAEIENRLDRDAPVKSRNKAVMLDQLLDDLDRILD